MIKCNLASAWKNELRSLEQSRKNAARDELDRKQQADHDALLIKLDKEGWQFTIDRCIHPHDNEEIETPKFRSPRMQHYASYSYKTDLFFAEAKCFALEVFENLGYRAKNVIIDALTHHFLENPSDRNTPEMSVMINTIH